MNDDVQVLVDAPNTYAKNRYKLAQLSTSDGRPSGALYGSIRAVQSCIARFEPARVVLAFEGGGSEARREIYADYKGDRPEGRDMFADIDELKLWALASGHSIAQCPGLEADDCIAALTQDWSGQSIIVSSDHDFKKLLQDNRVWLCRDSTKGVLYTHDDLEKELGITPAQYLLVGVLTGDPSDNVKGVPGVGPKTAIKLLRRHEWNIFAVMQDPKVAPHADAVARNFELIGWREPHGPWLVEGEFNDDVLIDIFERWEFNSMLEGLRERQA